MDTTSTYMAFLQELHKISDILAEHNLPVLDEAVSSVHWLYPGHAVYTAEVSTQYAHDLELKNTRCAFDHVVEYTCMVMFSEKECQKVTIEVVHTAFEELLNPMDELCSIIELEKMKQDPDTISITRYDPSIMDTITYTYTNTKFLDKCFAYMSVDETMMQDA